MAFSILDFVGGKRPGEGAMITSNPAPVGIDRPEAMAAPPMPPQGELLTPPGPQVGQDFRAAKPGFLEGLGTPDERGLTFGDKLFAAGSVLQGDSGGAATFLGNQRAAHDALTERNRARELSEAGLAALEGAIGEDGNFNLPAYLRAIKGKGIDPAAGLQMAQGLAPKRQIQNAGGGGLYEITTPQFGGESSSRELVKPGRPKPPLGQRYNPETGELEIDPLALAFLGQKADITGQAQVKYRRPLANNGGGRRDPKQGYGADEVTF